MSIASAVGQTYTDNQVSVGTATVSSDGSSYAYKESSQINPDSLTITSLAANGVDFQFTYTSGTGTKSSTVTADGTVLANSQSGFVFTSFIAGFTQTFYVTNSPTQQPGVGNTVNVPSESSNVTYSPPCYCAGTLIRTVRGDVAVEELVVGDEVLTVSGQARPIRWIGTRAYAGRFFSATQAVWPIRFRAGALGTDAAGQAMPSRDLLVSPKHAMLIDGVLVPAELLVNGRTIVRDGSARQVSYFHVELPVHDAIWAENAPSETFIDDGSRMMFQNAASFTAARPDAAPEYCAPRIEGGEALVAIRGRLDAVRLPAATLALAA